MEVRLPLSFAPRTKLNDYTQFDGLHWETGSIRNFYDYQGVKAPHSGQPYTEALLMGISGGIVMGYFSFAYQGYDPHVSILTRNTFNPLDTLLERLGVVQNRIHTSSPTKAVSNLVSTLEDDMPAIIWADMFSLPYNLLPYDDGMWAMFPILVYGYDEPADTVWIADRASVPLTISIDELAVARARVKKDKFRILMLDAPNADKIPAAVQKGIWDCVKLFTEHPPKGSKNNFGFAAYRRWADLLLKPGLKLSWEKEFPAGDKMYAGLTSAFTDITTFGKDGGAERAMYADFLGEASQILDKPALTDVAQQFRASEHKWSELATALLPDEVQPFKETRELLLQKHKLFIEQGPKALPAMQQIADRLDQIKTQISADFPLSQPDVLGMRENIQMHVMAIHDTESEAIAALQEAMA